MAAITISPNLETTVKPEIASFLRSYWSDKNWIKLLKEKILPFSTLGEVVSIPKNQGNRVQFQNMARIPALNNPLTEGITPEPSTLSTNVFDATVNQFGMFVLGSDRSKNETELGWWKQAADRIKDNMIETLERVHKTNALAGTNVFYGDGTVTDSADITASMTISVTLLNRIYTQMRILNVEPAEGGYYLLIVNPATMLGLKSDPLWNQYALADKYSQNASSIQTGEIHYVAGFKIVCTNVIDSAVDPDSDVVLSTNVAVGKNAFARIKIEGEAPEIIEKPLGYGEDNLNQRFSIGWKGTFGSKIVQNSAIMKIVTADPGQAQEEQEVGEA
jgi:N4-gp56 family major capsid protein